MLKKLNEHSYNSAITDVYHIDRITSVKNGFIRLSFLHVHEN